MALRGPIEVPFERAFPKGAFTTADEVKPLYGFEEGLKGQQETDEQGRLMWTLTITDADKDVDGQAQAVKVKIASKYAPELPPQYPGLELRPLVLEGLTATPYIGEGFKGRPKLAYSFRATGISAPKPVANGGSGNEAPKTNEGQKPNGTPGGGNK